MDEKLYLIANNAGLIKDVDGNWVSKPGNWFGDDKAVEKFYHLAQLELMEKDIKAVEAIPLFAFPKSAAVSSMKQTLEQKQQIIAKLG